MMSLIALEPALQTWLEEVAQDLGQPAESLVGEAVAARLEALETEKLEAETTAFKALHPQLKHSYLHQFVAIHHGQVVDVDPDWGELYQRVQERFGNLAILLREVEEEPDRVFVFHSVRLEPER